MRNEFRTVGARLRTFAFVLSLATAASLPVAAQTFSVVYSFTGGADGGNPLAGLVRGTGYLYGTTSSGGAHEAGAIYEINETSGLESVLYSFTGGTDGNAPESGLLLSGTALFGTTSGGGKSGAGTVFEVTTAGKETVLYNFTGGADGGGPQDGLTKDVAGNLYGTTYSGGNSGTGAVFELMRPKTGGAWKEKVLYSFGTGTDGANPVAGVTFDKAGNLYGTTSAGGTYTYGTVFQLKPSGAAWTENILHEFALGDDGGVPYAGLILSPAGDLFGASTDGGLGSTNGGGTVFELTPSGTSWTFSTIYELAGWGISGSFRNLMLSGGNIYATTHCDGNDEAGTVYELSPSGSTWNYTSLYQFLGGSDGLYSYSNLTLYDGYFWGTTKQGGTYGQGVVFKVSQ